jgi:hypothetical protein
MMPVNLFLYENLTSQTSNLSIKKLKDFSKNPINILRTVE